jgi:DNA-binding NarL/FixJ family response regulator
MEQITLLLVTGEPGLHRGLQMRLEVEPGFAVIGESGDLREVTRLAGELAPHVIVLDADLPSGPEAAVELVRSLSRRHRLVVLSLEDGVAAAATMLAAGATAFVRKHDRSERLIAAIRTAASTVASASPGEEPR